MKQAKIITLLTATTLLAGCSHPGSLTPVTTTSSTTSTSSTTTTSRPVTTTVKTNPLLNTEEIIYVYEEPGKINSPRNGFIALSSKEFNKLKQEEILAFFKKALKERDIKTQKTVSIFFMDKGTAIQVSGEATVFRYGTYDISTGKLNQIGEEGYIYNEKTKQYYTSVTNQPFIA